MTSDKTIRPGDEIPIDFTAREGSVRRQMVALVPSLEQLAVWTNNADKITDDWNEWKIREAAFSGQEDTDEYREFVREHNQWAMHAVQRGLRMIGSLLPSQRDRDWVEDKLMSREIDLAEALGVLTSTVGAIKVKAESAGEAKPPKATSKARLG